MVFFTCDACGSSLKKNQVEKHYNSQCRRCAVLTCMDCQKEFPGDSYKTHTSCISEAEKYSAKGWQPKANANKGLKKQNAWIESIQEAVEQLGSDMDKDVKSLLDGIMAFDNIPRKKPKFVNFVKNVVGGGKRCSPATIEKTWSIFESAIKKKQDTSTSSAPMAPIEVENINTVATENSRSQTINNKRESVTKQSENIDPSQQNGIDGPEFGKCLPKDIDKDSVINQGVVKFPGTKKHKQDMAKEESKISKKKRKLDNEITKNGPSTTNDALAVCDSEKRMKKNKFDWDSAVSGILATKSDQVGAGYKMKTLKKKLIKMYCDQVTDATPENVDAKVSKRLSKLQSKYNISSDGKRIKMQVI